MTDAAVSRRGRRARRAAPCGAESHFRSPHSVRHYVRPRPARRSGSETSALNCRRISRFVSAAEVRLHSGATFASPSARAWRRLSSENVMPWLRTSSKSFSPGAESATMPAPAPPAGTPGVGPGIGCPCRRRARRRRGRGRRVIALFRTQEPQTHHQAHREPADQPQRSDADACDPIPEPGIHRPGHLFLSRYAPLFVSLTSLSPPSTRPAFRRHLPHDSSSTACWTH